MKLVCQTLHPGYTCVGMIGRATLGVYVHKQFFQVEFVGIPKTCYQEENYSFQLPSMAYDAYLGAWTCVIGRYRFWVQRPVHQRCDLGRCYCKQTIFSVALQKEPPNLRGIARLSLTDDGGYHLEPC